MKNNLVKKIKLANGEEKKIFALKNLKENGTAPNLERLPVSIRIILESLLRNFDGKKVSEEDINNLANYNAKNPGNYEIPFTVARIVLQDFTGVPLLVDLAAMRDAAKQNGSDPKIIEPQVPVDLVIDHSVQVDFAGFSMAFERNLTMEFIRNRERYEFLKWGQQAFDTFNVVPPGIGIVHQVNLEYLAKGILANEEYIYPDTLVGTDSHTTMINGLGIVGWGVGGIEAEAGMLGQPISFLVPEVIGVDLSGDLPEGITATDLVLRVTEMLREYGVVGKFVEFFGEGTKKLSVPDRATIANMAPEYGATIGFFPIDDKTIDYYKNTGRSEEHCQDIKNYFQAQGIFGIPRTGEIDYSEVLHLDLSTLKTSVAGPKRPQDRIEIDALKNKFDQLLTEEIGKGGFGLTKENKTVSKKLTLNSPVGEVANENFPEKTDKNFKPIETQLTNGSILIAAITSCTNTSNPSVMLAAGLVAKKANELGLKVPDYVKTSLAPGSRVVTNYLETTGLQKELDELGFNNVGYGCTTCIGNSGPLHPEVEKTVRYGNLVCASVLSGNRNFEARIHSAIKANFLMSPPLVVIFALAGTVNIDLQTEAIATNAEGKEIYLKDLWPSKGEISALTAKALNSEVFQKYYSDFEGQNQKWNEISTSTGATYAWDKNSTYIKNPPFFDNFSTEPIVIEDLTNAKLLGFYGDSVTTDHISPAGAIPEDSPAGEYLKERGVNKANFNSFGSRRGNDRIMTRGTFANVRIKNLMVAGSEGGVTRFYGNNGKNNNSDLGKVTSVYEAAQAYKNQEKNLFVIAGDDYGMGSSRDWAAKGTLLLGVKAVVVKSFERIHRSNLIGMGILPLTFNDANDYEHLKNDEDIKAGNADFSIVDLNDQMQPKAPATLIVKKSGSTEIRIPLTVRLDTPIEIEYYKNRGILHYVLKELIAD